MEGEVILCEKPDKLKSKTGISTLKKDPRSSPSGSMWSVAADGHLPDAITETKTSIHHRSIPIDQLLSAASYLLRPRHRR